jgi:predicted transcriptional regulator
LKPEELRVLKIMNEVTHRMDLNEFAQAAELEVSEALQCIQDLAKSGHLKRSGGGYGITEKGKAVLKVQSSVADGLEFRFYSELGQPTGVSARSVMEFYETIKMIDPDSLEFHLYRGDFKNWVEAVLEDGVLAGELESLSHGELKGESLREKLVAVIEARYGAEALR